MGCLVWLRLQVTNFLTEQNATNATLLQRRRQSLFTNVHGAFTIDGTVSGTALLNNQAETRSKVKKIYELYVALGDLAESGGVQNVIKLISNQHYHFKVVGIVRGFWEENPQDTLLVQVSDTEQALEQTIEKLKEYLETDAVWAQDIQDTFNY